ncbi:MAG: isoprenylcysteine carboxylmethyltransferase family protein [Pseudomonadota bacterium]
MKWIDLPPVWLIGAMALMWALAGAAPWPGAPAIWVGRAIILAAIALMVWTAISFRRRRTTIVPHMEPDALVTDGPMRFSRNPIYAADVAILIGWGVSLGAALPFLIVPAFAVVIQRRFILAEEARLEAAFGAAFRDYKTRVGRWI